MNTPIDIYEKYTLPEGSIIILKGKPMDVPTSEGVDVTYVHCFFRNNSNTISNRMVMESDVDSFLNELTC